MKGSSLKGQSSSCSLGGGSKDVPMRTDSPTGTGLERYLDQLYVEYKNAELIETESKMVVTRGWKWDDQGRCWSNDRNLELEDE